MKIVKSELSTLAKQGITRREGLMLTLLSSALVLAGCGGGGGGSSPASSNTSGVTGGGTGSSAAGAITGFGSIIVGGVRYDDSKASVKDDDGASKSSSDLKLGMTVKIKGGKRSDDGLRAAAESIEVHSELVGPIDSKTATSIVVFGQTVDIYATTFFEDGLTLASLAVGNVVEVYGFVNPGTGTMAATRVERKTNPTKFKLQGAVSALNTTTKIFNIGSLVIAYTSAEMPAILTLANGLVVRVRLDTAPLIGTRTANKIRTAEHQHEDSDEAEVEGIITAFTSTNAFSVNGLAVNASSAIFKDGMAGVVLGARVEVEGRVVNGVLIARKVEIEGDEDDKDYKEDMHKFELHGLVSDLNTTAMTFKLRGVSVSYTATTEFTDGLTRANLANGSNVEVKGTLLGGNQLLAKKVSRES